MSNTAHVAAIRVAMFLANEEPDKAATSLVLYHGVVAKSRAGDHQSGAGTFVPIGGAVAETRDPQHDYGGVDGVAGLGTVLAEYDPKAKRVYPLNQIGQRDPRTSPWEVGRNISLQCDPLKPSVGHVVRGNQTGDSGYDQHVFFAGNAPGNAPLILHHDTPGAPDESTDAFEGDLSRNAKLSDIARIGAGVDELCPSVTSSAPPGGRDWVYLNATKHGGNRFSGYLPMRFAGKDALASAEVGGMIRPASDIHNFAFTADNRWLARAALSIANTLWTNGNPAFDAPLGIEEVDEPPVTLPQGHPVRCPIQFDPLDVHPHLCAPGTKPKKIKVHVKVTIPELPPCEGSRQTVGADGPTAYYAGSIIQGGIKFMAHPRA